MTFLEKGFMKLVIFVVLATLIFTCLQGCGKNQNEKIVTQESTVKATEQSRQETTQKIEEPAVLKLVVWQSAAGDNFDRFATHYIEEKTNTKLEVTSVVGAELENKLNIILASRDLPDIIQYMSNDAEAKYSSEGILLPLNKYFDKAQNLYKSRSQEIWDVMKYNDGNIYAVGIETAAVQFVPLYRKDWLEKFNMKIPETIDEYYSVADAVSNRDPDGNSKKDTYAFGSIGQINRYLDHVFGAFGVMPNFWMVKNGNIVNGTVLPGAKEALKFLNKMYEAGMIDPEFVTDNQERNYNKQYAGIYGAQCNFYWIVDESNIYGHRNKFKGKNPDGEYITGPVLKGPGESVGLRKASQRGWLKTSIISSSKNIDAALRLLDWNATEEGVLFNNYGLEGEHYSKDQDGMVKVIIDNNKKNELGINQLALVRTALFSQTSPLLLKVMGTAEKTGLADATDGIVIDERGKYEVDLQKYTDGEFFKMITGSLPIEGGFESFVAEWGKRGGTELTNALDKAYKERAN